MMHNNGVVVVVQSGAHPLREFDHRRVGSTSSSTVVLPFGSEYSLLFRFHDGKRRRLELTIDGTLITDSLIVYDGSVLERFLDSDKKFKFVTADNDAVSDPTSGSNGDIVVKLWEELYVVPPTPRPQRIKDYRLSADSSLSRCKGVGDADAPKHTRSRGIFPQGMPDGINQHTFCSNTGPSASNADVSYRGSHEIGECCDRSLSFENSVSDRGATVEGSKSHQSFGSTTWAGDAGIPLSFAFHLRGRVVDAQIRNERPWACPSCGKRVPGGARYCPSCGVEVEVFASTR